MTETTMTVSIGARVDDDMRREPREAVDAEKREHHNGGRAHELVEKLSSGFALYVVSPADLVPDFIPLLGSLDDAVLMALAARLARDQLRAYGRFKGYSVEQCFGPGA